MTMIFDFLKKIFGWADESSRKRKVSENCNFGEDYITSKKVRTNCNTSHSMDNYIYVDESDDEDDIIFLGEQKCSAMRQCVKLNGTHKKKSYQTHTKIPSPTCKSTCSSLHHNNSMMKHSPASHKYTMQDTSHGCPTLSKTNQLKERFQYEILLHNFLPDRIHVVKDKRTLEYSPVQKPVEVIDLDKEVNLNNKTKLGDIPETSYRHRSSVSNYSRVDKEKVPSNDKSNNATCSGADKLVIIGTNVSAVKHLSRPKSPIKMVATNSLRDELAAKPIMRQDFMAQVEKQYNERMEQRHREAEELKKMTCALSNHNRYVRAAALEEQLARTMKLCLAVLDDREEPEEPALPKLTDSMLRDVKNALVSCPPDEVLAEGFGLRITRKDIHTLAGLNWLNDEVINFYMNLLIARGTNSDKYPKVHAMNTFFYPKLLSGGHSSLRRWTRKVDIFAQDLVVVPVHLDIHWCMSIIDFREKMIVYYDSMGSSNPKCLAALKQYLQDESLDKKKQPFDMSGWRLQSAKNIPQQMNGSDCGVFSCMFAEYACANRRVTFTQEDMPYFRSKMVYEILKGKLL
ncbi:sentrin-specific protease 1-like [Linepithema humile]|uniref:sentrin-specific protease 1-like n=1 Tax=Linepithema humile TaxID=83485 RepID=UPI00062370AA|nr:PREDICTED: sentrin-specific protease 1-like [Linepithema humile]